MIVFIYIRSLLKDVYLDEENFVKERCRLPLLQHQRAYAVYVKYEDEPRSRKMWDDSDRVLDLLVSSIHCILYIAVAIIEEKKKIEWK